MKTTSTSTATKPETNVLLTLDPALDEDEELTSENSTSFLLRSTPANADSPKYKLACRILQGHEGTRTLFQWREQVLKVLHGLNVITHETQRPIVETMLKGTPLTLFEVGVNQAKRAHFDERIEAAADDAARNAIIAETMEHANNLTTEQVQDGIKAVLTSLMPRRVLGGVILIFLRQTHLLMLMQVLIV